MLDWHPITLSVDVIETRGGPSAGNRVTITSVERDASRIHVDYEIVPPLGLGSHTPWGEAKDDLGNDYRNLGGHFGLTGSTGSTHGEGVRYRGRLNICRYLPGRDHASHPDHMGSVGDPDAVGRAPLIDLGEASARSPRLAAARCGTLTRYDPRR